VHWQVTRIIAIRTVPNKSVSREDDNCVKFAVNRTTFVPCAPRQASRKAGLRKRRRQARECCIQGPDFNTMPPRPHPGIRGRAKRFGWHHAVRRPGVSYRPFWKFSNRSPTHGLETKLSGSITRRPRRVPPADRPLGTPHLFSELRRHLIREGSVRLTHSGCGRQGG
jgi:hypothetical protein